MGEWVSQEGSLRGLFGQRSKVSNSKGGLQRGGQLARGFHGEEQLHVNKIVRVLEGDMEKNIYSFNKDTAEKRFEKTMVSYGGTKITEYTSAQKGIEKKKNAGQD